MTERLVERFGGSPPLRLVDIGCGNGYITGRLARKGHEVVGVDVAKDGVEIARKVHPGARFVRASIYDDDLTELLEPPVDVVTAIEVIEHLHRPRALLQRASELLKPGGTLILSTPYHGYLKNLLLTMLGRWDHHHQATRQGGHVKFFSRSTLEELIQETGFTVDHWEGVGRAPYLWKSQFAVAFAPPRV